MNSPNSPFVWLLQHLILTDKKVHTLGQCLALAQSSLPHGYWSAFLEHFFKTFYLFIFRERGREKETERNTNQLPPVHALTRDWTHNQACSLTKNRTGNLSFCKTMPNELSHTGQGQNNILTALPSDQDLCVEILGKPHSPV